MSLNWNVVKHSLEKLLASLRVAVPSPRGKTGGRELLPPFFPRGEGTATRRLAVASIKGAFYK